MSFQCVSKSKPCEICGSDHWCGITDDGCLAVCMRVESSKMARNGGYVHRLRDDDHAQPRVRRVMVKAKAKQDQDFDQLSEQYERGANDRAVQRLAYVLGVSSDALRRLSVGYDGEAWTFPMCDATGCIVGIRRRFHDGRKRSVLGGHEGVFLPDGLADDSTIVITEGPTDCAAVLSLGFDAIGRPSCRGGTAILAAFCRERRVAIMADGDKPGLAGAWGLATALRLVCVDVRVIHPPVGIKDARAWVQAGGTQADVQKAIDIAEPVRMEVRCV